MAMAGEIRHIDFSKELKFSTSRSSGKGGQHVNKVETRVELAFDVQQSQLLDAEQKAIISEKLKSRINEKGLLKISSQAGRSQSGNKADALRKFCNLLEQALKVEVERKPTKVPKFIKVKRLKDKRHRSEVKKKRGKVTGDG